MKSNQRNEQVVMNYYESSQKFSKNLELEKIKTATCQKISSSEDYSVSCSQEIISKIHEFNEWCDETVKNLKWDAFWRTLVIKQTLRYWEARCNRKATVYKNLPVDKSNSDRDEIYIDDDIKSPPFCSEDRNSSPAITDEVDIGSISNQPNELNNEERHSSSMLVKITSKQKRNLARVANKKPRKRKFVALQTVTKKSTNVSRKRKRIFTCSQCGKFEGYFLVSRKNAVPHKCPSRPREMHITYTAGKVHSRTGELVMLGSFTNREMKVKIKRLNNPTRSLRNA